MEDDNDSDAAIIPSQTKLGEDSDVEKPSSSKQTKSKRCEQCKVKPKQFILYAEYDANGYAGIQCHNFIAESNDKTFKSHVYHNLV